MTPMRLIIAALALGFLAQPSAAFQQSTGSDPAVTSDSGSQGSKSTNDTKGLNLTIPGVTLGRSNGTEVRIPGLGTVGVLPKLDFGLELLYGANNDSKVLPEDKNDANDVQIRGTIKHRF